MNKIPTSSATSLESTAALRRLFGWLESNYGGLVFDPPRLISTTPLELKAQHLLDLMSHRATALHIKKFYPKSAAVALGKKLAEEAHTNRRNWKISTSRGLESSDVSTLGEHPPFNIATAMGKEQEYFQGVTQELYKRRFEMNSVPKDDDDSSSPLPTLWPLDLLRLNLDEAWPQGAGLARSQDGHPFSAGLPRIMEGPSRWKKGLIHVDEMGPLDPKQGLFSANIYLQMPDQEETVLDEPKVKNSISNSTNDKEPPSPLQDTIHIWPLGIRSRWDWYRNALSLSGLSSQDAADQMRLWSVLGEPVTVQCEPGDLVLLCVQRPHCAVGFERGTRISLQCFIQHNGADQTLKIDT